MSIDQIDFAERQRRKAFIQQTRRDVQRAQAIEKARRRQIIQKARAAVRSWQAKTSQAAHSNVDLKKIVDDRIDIALSARKWESDALREGMGIALARVRRQLREEFNEKLAVLRAEMQSHGRLDDDEIVLPKFLKSRHAV